MAPPPSRILLLSLWVTVCLLLAHPSLSFQPSLGAVRKGSSRNSYPGTSPMIRLAANHHPHYQPKGVLLKREEENENGVVNMNHPDNNNHEHLHQPASWSAVPVVMVVVLLGNPTPALAASASAGPVSQAALAWLHFLGLVGVAGGLIAERFLISPNMSIEEEIKINNADGIYGLSAFSLLITGYFRVTEFGKGWDFYKNEPIFWFKMSSVAILGGLSFFPAIVFFRRDQARQKGDTLAPLSDALVERITRLLNSEILALLTIPLLASLMARGGLVYR